MGAASIGVNTRQAKNLLFSAWALHSKTVPQLCATAANEIWRFLGIFNRKIVSFEAAFSARETIYTDKAYLF